MRPLAIIGLLGLAGCGQSSTTRFWTIEPVSAAPIPAGRAIAPVQVVAVHVPLAIDRLEIVQHDAANRIAVHDFDRWSAPPGDLMRRALTQDLIGRLPAGSVVSPDLPAPPRTRGIVVDLLDLRQEGSAFVMTVGWSSTGPAPVRRQLQLDAPAGAGDVAAETQALGTLVGQLADSIAEALTR